MMMSDGIEEMNVNPSLNDGLHFYIDEDVSDEKGINVEELNKEINKELLNDINYEVDLNKLNEFILELENLDAKDLENNNTD